MHFRLTLPSSEVSRTTFEQGELRLHLSAALVKRDGTWGHVGQVTLAFEQTQVTGDLHQAMGALTGGELWLNGQLQRDLPLPGQHQGQVRADLGFQGGEHLSIIAQGLRCELGPNALFRESMAC